MNKTNLWKPDQTKILIVDDRFENLLAMKTVLKNINATMATASSGNEALSHVLREEFALILLDVQMPGMDGYEIASLIREHEPARYTPIIFVTAISKEDNYVSHGYRVGAVDYLVKPLDSDILLAKVKVYLDLYNQKKKLTIALSYLETIQSQLESRNEELRRSNEEFQNFAYVASHDLQEPLRKIQTFGNRLQKQCSELLNEQGHDYLSRMQNAAGRMHTLIDDLLFLSRVESEGRPFVPVNLNDMMKEVVGDLESRIEQAGGRVDLSELPTLEVDPTQIRRVFQNIIGNALKFTKKESTPVVSVAAEKVAKTGTFLSTSDSDLWEISIVDNGIGFDAEYQERIFGMFQRLHGRSEYEGTGMGLAICRKIVERHGGTIKATSVPGEGATFTIRLPACQTQELVATA